MTDGNDPQVALAVQATKEDVEHKLRENSDALEEFYYSLPSTPNEVEGGDMMYFHNGEGYWGSCVLTRVENSRVYFFPIEKRSLIVDERVPPERGFRYLYRRDEE